MLCVHVRVVPCAAGNQFIPKGFYATMQSVFRQNEYFKRFAVLIPMLRIRQEQDSELLNAQAPLRSIMQEHFTSSGDFLISEPQLALHVHRINQRNLNFDERSQYGRSNKAALVGKLCSRRDRLSLSTRCCEVVRANMRTLGLRMRYRSGYNGGEVNLKNRVYDITKRRGFLSIPFSLHVVLFHSSISFVHSFVHFIRPFISFISFIRPFISFISF